MNLKSTLALVLAIIAITDAKRVRYDGYQVYRLTPATEKHVQMILTADSREVTSSKQNLYSFTTATFIRMSYTVPFH